MLLNCFDTSRQQHLTPPAPSPYGEGEVWADDVLPLSAPTPRPYGVARSMERGPGGEVLLAPQ
jgi:hypothetical protein